MTSFVTELIEGAVKQGGGKISIDSSYERLLSETEKYRRELDSIEKALGDKFELVRGVAQKTMALNLQTVDLIVKELLQHQVNHHKDGFSERDKNDFIDWLETWKKNENAEKQLKRVQFEKYGVTIPENLNQEQALAKPKRFISKKDRCRCSSSLSTHCLNITKEPSISRTECTMALTNSAIHLKRLPKELTELVVTTPQAKKKRT